MENFNVELAGVGYQKEKKNVSRAFVERTLTKISNNAESVGDNVFFSYTTLQSVEFPLAKSVGAYAFKQCEALTNADLPQATSVGREALAFCRALTIVDLATAISIGQSAFYGCSVLKTLILRSETMATAGQSVLASTPIASGTGYIYVPAALIEDYKAAANWSTYAAQFRALEDYTVDGTITGALDESKT